VWGGGWITTSLLTSYTKLDKLNWSCLKLLNENKQDLALDRNVIATPKEILQMQSADILAIAITAILTIAAILKIDGLIKKPQHSCATLLELVLNYIYSKLCKIYFTLLLPIFSFSFPCSSFLYPLSSFLISLSS
jgi:hypothetical protein